MIMRIAAYICLGIFGVCIAPFVLGIFVAMIWCAIEGIRNFLRHPDGESLFEFLANTAFIFGCLGGVLLCLSKNQ